MSLLKARQVRVVLGGGYYKNAVSETHARFWFASLFCTWRQSSPSRGGKSGSHTRCVTPETSTRDRNGNTYPMEFGGMKTRSACVFTPSRKTRAFGHSCRGVSTLVRSANALVLTPPDRNDRTRTRFSSTGVNTHAELGIIPPYSIGY